MSVLASALPRVCCMQSSWWAVQGDDPQAQCGASGGRQHLSSISSFGFLQSISLDWAYLKEINDAKVEHDLLATTRPIWGMSSCRLAQAGLRDSHCCRAAAQAGLPQAVQAAQAAAAATPQG